MTREAMPFYKRTNREIIGSRNGSIFLFYSACADRAAVSVSRFFRMAVP